MKHRPTEIPYIPKDKRRSRFAPRDGGKILSNNKGIEALRQTDGTTQGKKKGGNGCGCTIFIIGAWLAFSDGAMEFAEDLLNTAGLRTENAPEETAPEVRQLPPPITQSPVPPPAGTIENARSFEGDVRALFTADDYPSQSLRDGEQGTVRVRLTINRLGMPRQCTIEQSSGYRRLDEATCRILLERARFEPAVNEAGEVVQGFYTVPPIRWQLAE